MPEIHLLPDSDYEWPGSEDDEPDDEQDEESEDDGESPEDVTVIVISDGEGSPGEDAPLVWAPAPDPGELREMLAEDGDDY